MGERRRKWIIAGAAVAAVYSLSAYAICSDPVTCAAAERAMRLHIPGALALAMIPTAMFAFFLTVDTALPLGRSALDIVHDGIVGTHRHLFVEGERNDYWHLRIVIALTAIAAVQLIAIAVECLRGG